jgi:hypothetical protein
MEVSTKPGAIQSEIIRHTAPNASLQLVATAKVIVSSNAPRALTESPRIL